MQNRQKPHTFFLCTLGCKINQYESQALREAWARRGFVETDSARDAQVVLVNSCAVTANAVRDVRGAVRQAHRDNPAARIIITGCAAQVLGEELARLPGVEQVVPQTAKDTLQRLPEGFFTGAMLPVSGGGAAARASADHNAEYSGAEPVLNSSDARLTESRSSVGESPAPVSPALSLSDSAVLTESGVSDEEYAAAVFPEQRSSGPSPMVSAPAGQESLPKKEGDAAFPAFSVSGSQRARAVVKVQDGCSHRCTYCIVPLARGRSRSRSVSEIVDEVRVLLDGGFREIILSGVNLRQFGCDLEATPPSAGVSACVPGVASDAPDAPAVVQAARPDFWSLVDTLERTFAAEWAGKARFRLSSLEPGQLNDRALETFAASRLIAPQLHISMQSGSNSVLRRMGRGHYTVEPLLTFLERLRAVWPVYGLGADILMGFPGETDEEFARTLEIVRAMPLTYAHVFPYSRRPGTAAARMPDQLPREVRTARARAVRELVAEKKAAFLNELVRSAIPLDVVVQSLSSREGISQVYTECRFASLPEGSRVRGLNRGVAQSVENGTLQLRFLEHLA